MGHMIIMFMHNCFTYSHTYTCTKFVSFSVLIIQSVFIDNDVWSHLHLTRSQRSESEIQLTIPQTYGVMYGNRHFRKSAATLLNNYSSQHQGLQVLYNIIFIIIKYSLYK